jgi:hypothetical protein
MQELHWGRHREECQRIRSHMEKCGVTKLKPISWIDMEMSGSLPRCQVCEYKDKNKNPGP